jgi:hypothetical protein
MSFDEFWKLYPRKVAKKAAQKVWSRMTVQEQLDCIESLPNHLAYWKLKQTEMDYICHPTTFLSQGRWEDELDMEVKKNKKPDLPWYSSEELTIKKALEVQCPAYAGEGWQQWRSRISQKIKQLDEQL